MNEVTIDFINEVVNSTVNGLFADIQTKEKAQLNLLVTIVASCKKYERDNRFKNEINRLGRYLENVLTPTK